MTEESQAPGWACGEREAGVECEAGVGACDTDCDGGRDNPCRSAAGLCADHADDTDYAGHADHADGMNTGRSRRDAPGGGAMNVSRGGRRTLAIAAVGLVAATTLLGGCGSSEAIPMNDEYAGNSGESSAAPDSSSSADASGSSDGSSASADASGSSGWSSLSAGSASPSASSSSAAADGKDADDYRDGTYSVNSKYGPVNEDSIDVKVTVKDQKITDVEVTGHPFTSISKKHQDAFAKAIPGVVVGKKLKGLDVDTVAGASWTTEAFNKALETAREQASQ